MRLRRLIWLAAVVLVLLQGSQAQEAGHGLPPPSWQVAAGTKLGFVVATIRPGQAEGEPAVAFTLGPGDAYAPTGGRFFARNLPLLDYLEFAFKLDEAQTRVLEASAPQWVSQKVFDIEGRAETEQPTKDQMRLMMQSLLADRFGLRTHREERALPALVLVTVRDGRPGPRLRRYTPGPGDGCAGNPPGASLPGRADGEDRSGTGTFAVPCGVIRVSGVPEAPSRLRVEGHAVTLQQLATQLGQMGQYRRPLVDATGLAGAFDVTLEWGPETVAPAPAPAPASQPGGDGEVQNDLERGLADQLGLRLQRRSAVLPVVVVDAIQPQPTPN